MHDGTPDVSHLDGFDAKAELTPVGEGAEARGDAFGHEVGQEPAVFATGRGDRRDRTSIRSLAAPRALGDGGGKVAHDRRTGIDLDRIRRVGCQSQGDARRRDLERVEDVDSDTQRARLGASRAADEAEGECNKE